ncbi:MAG: YbhB/YbcL family Raf kinase inhibitor-like protein [Planctomycetota bacterium]
MQTHVSVTCAVWAMLLVFGVTAVAAHDGDHAGTHDHSAVSADRIWNLDETHQQFTGHFVSLKGTQVLIRQSDGLLRPVELSRLSSADQAWVRQRQQSIQQLNAWIPAVLPVAPITPVTAAVAVVDHLKLLEASFRPFAPAVTTRSDNDFFYVESAGMPDHQMMVGITAWQQQVPLPQTYTGNNAWRIPRQPVPAKEPMSAKTGFFRGAIAIAVNGVPIFNPIKNDGKTDTLVAGELDDFGGHCGRADDYHYHIAPVHLQKQAGAGQPVAWALDGYPIYGYQDPSGPDFAPLDQWNGHRGPDGNYHYHATKTYPYLNGGFFGEVLERDGQVDPQPRASSPRPALPPLRGAKITAFRQANAQNYVLTYEINGRPGTVSYTVGPAGSVSFTFRSPDGETDTRQYTARPQGGPGAPRGQGRKNADPPPGEMRPPRPDERPPGSDPPPKKQEGKGPGKGGKQKQGKKNTPPPGERPMAQPASPASKSQNSAAAIRLESRSVDANGRLTVDCTCDGRSESPAIAWSGLPEGTKFVAVSLWHEAPDQEKSYWVVYNIPAAVTSLPQNFAAKPTSGVTGINDRKQRSYDPMCSRGPGVKTYHITVYALSRELQLDPGQASRSALRRALKDALIAESTLDFEYER